MLEFVTKDNKLYIIIVTYNAMTWISKCLESAKSYPVIVVDNDSSDETTTFIQKNYPNIVLLPQKENLGFGQANNIGISYAYNNGADFFFLLNQDAYLVDGCLEKLLAVQRRQSLYGILSPIHLNGKADMLDKNFSNYVNYNANPRFYSDFILKKQQEIYEVPFVNAAGWLISKKCLQTVGGFDPIFFHYGEDDNYCQRVQFHKFKIGIIANAFLLHDRENRIKENTVKYSDSYFKLLERQCKVKYANINIDRSLEIEKKSIALKKSIIKQLVLFKFKNISNIKKQLRLIEKIEQEIKISREKNRKKGLHYL